MYQSHWNATLFNAVRIRVQHNYYHFTCAKDLWNELNGHYGFEGEGTKNFAMTKYISFQMCEEKNVSRQIENFQKISFRIRQRG